MATDSVEERRGGVSGVIKDLKWRKTPLHKYECRVLLCPEADGGYSAHALRLPGVVSQGETLQAALENISDAFQNALQVYLESGDPIPWTDTKIERTKGSLERWIIVNV